MNYRHLALMALPLLSANAIAGGISLSEVATFDSVSSAGVGNALNRKDASAAITSPAGLTAIEDSSFSLGVQYIDAAYDFRADKAPEQLGGPGKTKATSKQLAPGMAYAHRLNDRVVLGASLHADGGLGMEYGNGLTGQGLVDELSISAVNVNLAAGFQATPRLSLGGAIVIQRVDADLELSALGNKVKADGSSTDTGFTLSAMYDLSDSTFVSANYKSQIDHKYKLKAKRLPVNKAQKTSWPAIYDLGLSHNLTDQLTLKLRAAYEKWDAYGKADDKDMENVRSFGAALSYIRDRWTFQTGVRYDTEMMKTRNMKPDLAVGRQWAVGFGAEKQLNNNHRLGLAYEYRDMDQPRVEFEGVGVEGKYTKNRLHFLSLSYAY